MYQSMINSLIQFPLETFLQGTMTKQWSNCFLTQHMWYFGPRFTNVLVSVMVKMVEFRFRVSSKTYILRAFEMTFWSVRNLDKFLHESYGTCLTEFVWEIYVTEERKLFWGNKYLWKLPKMEVSIFSSNFSLLSPDPLSLSLGYPLPAYLQ